MPNTNSCHAMCVPHAMLKAGTTKTPKQKEYPIAVPPLPPPPPHFANGFSMTSPTPGVPRSHELPRILL